MSGYQYTYPKDLSHLDLEFGKTGPLRELAGQVWKVSGWIGGDLYDIVEDWPDVPMPEGASMQEALGEGVEPLPVSDEDRMRLHLGFGGTEDEVLALRAKDHRYTRMTRKETR